MAPKRVQRPALVGGVGGALLGLGVAVVANQAGAFRGVRGSTAGVAIAEGGLLLGGIIGVTIGAAIGASRDDKGN